MENLTTKMDGMTVGLDLGDTKSYYVCLDEDGDILDEGWIPTSPDSFGSQFGLLPPGSCVAMEVGTHSRWASRVIETEGHEVLVANARKFRAIHKNDRKSDREDALMLARVARMDPNLLFPIMYHRELEGQKGLALLRSRDLLVQSRTKMVSHVRGVVKSFGERVPSCSTECFPREAREHVPPVIKDAILPILKVIEGLTKRIKRFDKLIEKAVEKDFPETENLRSIPGVGPLTRAAFAFSIEDPERFKDNRDVGAYYGLCQRRSQSGDSDPQLPISKTGDSYIRTILVQCAHYILGHFGKDIPLREWGMKIAQRGGKNAKKRAAVAVARKLSVVMVSMWKSGTEFDPEFNRGPAKKSA